ncbi:hypothetical protein M0R45_006907 [Rubus argutus]|uniref:Uncharacterized protein n=1 Tax=Rubus argutus TaxID=59490 RepID=A0AAW1YRX8_RUBAR
MVRNWGLVWAEGMGMERGDLAGMMVTLMVLNCRFQLRTAVVGSGGSNDLLRVWQSTVMAVLAACRFQSLRR